PPTSATVLRPAAEPSPQRAVTPRIIDTLPARRKAALRVGESADFAVVARGAGLRYGRTGDGRPTGTGPRWVHPPAPRHRGNRRVDVTVTGPEGAEHRSWVVRVRPARPPTIVTAEPGRDSLRVDAGTPLRLRVDARARTPDERLDTTWTVDGKGAGNGSAV